MKIKPTLTLSLLSFTLLWSGCGRSGPPPVAATPDQAMLNVARAMQNNDPTGAWHMLPASYQNDLNEVVSAYAAAMDADLWNAGAATFGKVEEVLRTKQNLILNSSFANMAGGRAQLETPYGHAVTILGILKSSDLMDLQRMRNADLEKVISTTGRELMRELAKIDAENVPVPGMEETLGVRDMFAGLQAETISQDGDQALVRITVPGEPAEDVEFVRVEGKWIPADMAEEWEEMIADMREGVSEIAAIGPAEKSQALGMLAMVNNVLDQMLAANTAEELEAVLGGLMGMMMGGGF